MLEEEADVLRLALAQDLFDPVPIHWPSTRPGFPTDDHPIDPREVDLAQTFQQRLDGDKANARGKPCEVFVAPFDVRLLKTLRANRKDSIVQPDLVVVCDRAKLDERGCVGAPDWVVEVLSPSTAGKDHIHKRALYERNGVREYWLVHPVDGIVTIYRLGANGFDRPEILETEGQTPVGVVEGLVIDWDLLPATGEVREPDEEYAVERL